MATHQIDNIPSSRKTSAGRRHELRLPTAIHITEARKIAERIGADQVMVIAFSRDHYAAVSYGKTKALCADAGKWLDRICDNLADGTLPAPTKSVASE
jgi:hypothetical protein